MHPPEGRSRACRRIGNPPISDGSGDGLSVSGTPIISGKAQRAILLAGDGAPDSRVAGQSGFDSIVVETAKGAALTVSVSLILK